MKKSAHEEYYSIQVEMTIIMYLNFFPIFTKVLELFECRRGYLYMTADRTSFASLTRNKVKGYSPTRVYKLSSKLIF